MSGFTIYLLSSWRAAKKASSLELFPKTTHMEVTAAVLHDGALAHYDVSIEQDGICLARLSEYNRRSGKTPPAEIVLRREGRQWVSNEVDKDLSENLGYAIEIKAKPILEARNRTGSHPAG